MSVLSEARCLRLDIHHLSDFIDEISDIYLKEYGHDIRCTFETKIRDRLRSFSSIAELSASITKKRTHNLDIIFRRLQNDNKTMPSSRDVVTIRIYKDSIFIHSSLNSTLANEGIIHVIEKYFLKKQAPFRRLTKLKIETFLIPGIVLLSFIVHEYFFKKFGYSAVFDKSTLMHTGAIFIIIFLFSLSLEIAHGNRLYLSEKSHSVLKTFRSMFIFLSIVLGILASIFTILAYFNK